MRYSNGFLRLSSSGKHVGVLKYRDASGRWRQRTRTFTRDRDESLALLALWRAELAGGPPPGAARGGAPGAGGAGPRGPSPTVERAVRECLGAQLARGRIERSTHDVQLAYAERELFPELGAVPLASLTPALAQAWVDRMCLDIAPGSARVAYGVLRKACERAAVRGELAANPLGRVEAPARTPPARAYLPDGAAGRLEAAVDREWGASDGRACAVRLALHAGLRAGECCALRWRDVDPGRGWLRVSASVGRSAAGPYLKGPKCAASAREVPAVSALARALEARAQASGAAPGLFVCGPGAGDRFADPRSLSNAFARLCGREGIRDSAGRRATFHALRHTFATRAVRAGVDVRTLADLMGHARADVTLNVYAASGRDAKLAAAARLEGALRERRAET